MPRPSPRQASFHCPPRPSGGSSLHACWLRSAALILCGLLTLGFTPSFGAAQERNERQEREPLRTTGTVKGMRANVLHVVSEAGEPLLVRVPERPQNVVFEASADPTWLRPGMLVQFRASLNKRGQAADEVRELLVFTPREDSRLGVFPDAAGGAAGELFSGEGEQAPKRPRAGNEPVPCQVAGPLRSIRRGRISVAAGGMLVEADLADNVKISCDLADLSQIQEGDAAIIEGWVYAAQKNLVYANQLTVTAAQPLTLDPRILKKRAQEAKEAAVAPPEKGPAAEKGPAEKKE